MESTRNVELFGRKIFFVNPAYVIKNEVLKELQKQEYEVCLIDTYHDVKNILRRNPESLLFVNVDAQLSMSAWYNFIRSFEDEDELKSIHTTILSERIKANDKTLFENAKEVNGGVLMVDRDYEEIFSDVMNILKTTNAKGKRQYVRATMETDEDASFFWNTGSKMHQFSMLDLSTVGLSIRVPIQLTQIVSKNFILKEITLRLGSKQYSASAVVFGVKQEGDKAILILLFLPSTSSQVKDAIRNYVFLRMQNLIGESISRDIKDDRDYNKGGYYSSEKS